MEKLTYEHEEGFLEVKFFESELEALNEGKLVATRWQPEGKVYLQVIDPPSKYLCEDRFPISLAKKEYAVLDGEGLEIDLHVPWGVINHPFIRAVHFSKKLRNLKIEPANDSYDNLHIRLVFPSNSDPLY